MGSMVCRAMSGRGAVQLDTPVESLLISNRSVNVIGSDKSSRNASLPSSVLSEALNLHLLAFGLREHSGGI